MTDRDRQAKSKQPATPTAKATSTRTVRASGGSRGKASGESHGDQPDQSGGAATSQRTALEEARKAYNVSNLAKQTPEERLAAMEEALEFVKRRPSGIETELMEIIRPLRLTKCMKSKERGKAVQHHRELDRAWHEIEAELGPGSQKAR